MVSRKWSRLMPTKRVAAIAIGAVVLLTAAGAGAYWPFHHKPQPLRLPGTVEVQEVRLSSKIGGRVKAVAVHDGEMLKPGQVLVELEAPELEAQRDQAQQKRAAAGATLEKLLNGARPEEVTVADAAVKAAEAK